MARLGHVVEKQGRVVEAQKLYRKALELDDSLAEAIGDEQTLLGDEWSVDCTLGAPGGEVDLDLEMIPRLPEAWIGLPMTFRVATAIPLGADVDVDDSSPAGPGYSPGDRWHYDGSYWIDAEQPFLALAVEELNTGRRHGSLVECIAAF